MSAMLPLDTGTKWFGQPKGLAVLFLTEMWEKFSFFGMRALQVYYMMKQLHFSQADASLIYGIYAGGVYLTPIFGGLLADRWLGRRRAIVAGGTLMALGHFSLASEALFFPALVLIAVGNGLFLPNLPSQVGDLYEKDDPRRGGAFNIYYVGVNLGALLAPLVCGTLGELYGWHVGFGAAGAGMCLGLAIYLLGSGHLPPDGKRAGKPLSGPSTETSHGRFLPLVLVALAVVVFRSAYEQSGNALAVWAETSVDWSLGQFTIPVTWMQSLNPLFVFLLTPLVVGGWRRAAVRGEEASPLVKMAMGAAGLALSYLLLALLSTVHQGSLMSPLWVVAFFLLYTLGELYILPVGLGLFARLAPRRMGATVIAAWFLASFAGNLLAGVVGRSWQFLGSTLFFAVLAMIAAAAALALIAITPLMRRLECELAGATG